MSPCATVISESLFLSTPSARRATIPATETALRLRISIHALREEGDDGNERHTFPVQGFLSTPSARRATLLPLPSGLHRSYFYPRPPRGGRRQNHRSLSGSCNISIHALREEGDFEFRHITSAENEFLSTPSARRATEFYKCLSLSSLYFYPRPPRGGRRKNPLAVV